MIFTLMRKKALTCFMICSNLAKTGSFSSPMGGGGGLFFKYFSLSKETVLQFFSSLLSSQSYSWGRDIVQNIRYKTLTSILSHLLSMLTHFPLWQVNWFRWQALSWRWTLKMIMFYQTKIWTWRAYCDQLTLKSSQGCRCHSQPTTNEHQLGESPSPPW